MSRDGAQRTAPDDATLARQARAALGDLRRLIESARAMPLSASCVVSRTDALDLIEAVNVGLPAQIRRADHVLAQADLVVADARHRAEETLAKAEAEARRRVEEAERRAETLVAREGVVAEARARAERILAEAAARADRLARDADSYCDSRLERFAADLDGLRGQVERGRKVIAERLARTTDGTTERTPGGSTAEPPRPDPAAQVESPGPAA